MSWDGAHDDRRVVRDSQKGTPGVYATEGNRDRVNSLAGHLGISERLGEQEAQK